MPEYGGSAPQKPRSKRTGKAGKSLFAMTTLVLLAGCAQFSSVAPWEKEYLAMPEMVFEANPLEAGFDDHIYFSREGATGGWRMGGGGCGCN